MFGAAGTTRLRAPFFHAGNPARSARRLCLAVALGLALAAVAVVAPASIGAQTATTFVSNLSAGTDESVQLVGQDPVAQGFTTGSTTGGYTLTSVDIESNESNTTRTIAAKVCTVDASDNPTDSCTDLTAPSSFTTGVLNFTAPASATLDANTSYLVVMTPSSDSGFTWVTTHSDDQDSGAASGWSIANTYRLSLSGAWSADTMGRSIRIAVKGTEAAATNNAPTVANEIPDQTANVGAAFSYAFPANTFSDADSSDTLTYTATKSDDTALPSWLTFTASTRTFSGTPQSGDAGTLSVKVKADDSNGGTVTDTFDITVGAILVSNLTQEERIVGFEIVNNHIVQAFTTGSKSGG